MCKFCKLCVSSKKKEECKILTSGNGKRTLLMLQTHLRRLYNLRIQYILLFIYSGKSLLISGKHYNKSSNGYESSEFQRKYVIPDDVDAHTLTSNITPAGILFIEGARGGPPEQKITHSSTSSFGSVEIKNDSFEITLEVAGYSPDEISVRVNNNQLIIHGERKDEQQHDNSIIGKSVHHEQFTRKFDLPDDVNPDTLSSRFSKNKIVVVAPRKIKSDVNDEKLKMRKVEIVDECSSE